ncbi:MAG TPA: YciI family protein [Allosphingosinicella sp.]|nr:YciI family protein [Allosphingosinicella sp.]
MEIFAILRRRGPAFDPAAPVEGQPAWGPHAEYMMALARDGVLLLAGPLGDREGALLIVRAESAAQAEARIAADPWTENCVLETERVARWDVRIGALPSAGG